MILLRRVIGDALRSRRQSQHRTLREVSTAANVSLGYLSEIERGQKEASSELLAAICDALGAQLSELLLEVSQTVEVAESLTIPPVRATVPPVPALVGSGRRDIAHRVADLPSDGAKLPVPSGIMLPKAAVTRAGHQLTVDGDVAVSIRQDSPLKATLRAKRNIRSASERGRDPVSV